MHVHSIPIVCLHSTSANNGPPKPDFPATQSIPSRKPQIDTSALEPLKALFVSTASISGLCLLLPSPSVPRFRYCNCLRTLADNCGSVRRAPIWYAKGMASLRGSDTVQRQSPLWQEIPTAAYWFLTSSRAL